MALSVEAGASRIATSEITYILVYVRDENGTPVVGLQDENFQVSVHHIVFDLVDFWSVSLDHWVPGAYSLSVETGPPAFPGQAVFLVRVALTPAAKSGPSSIKAINAAMQERPGPAKKSTEPKLHPLDKSEGFALAPLVYFPNE